jgi:hypothetical protein
VRAPAQSYPTLLAWWAEQNGHGRHLWPGNGTFKVTDAGAARWPASEVVSQITLTRNQPGASGNVHFNMTALVRNSDALGDRLASGPYAATALVPASPWLSSANPATPSVQARPAGRRIALSITSTTQADRTLVSPPRWWLVRSRYGDGWRAIVADAKSATVDVPAGADGTLPDVVVVNAIDHAGVESESVRVLGGLGPGD